MKNIICGIDLGTTNSVIAYLNKGKPEALCVEDGTALVPSVVSLGETPVVCGAAGPQPSGGFS